MDSLSFLEVEGPRVYQPEPGYDERCSVCVWFILFYSLIVGALVLLVAWLFRANRRESRKRIHAQTRLLIQHRLVEQRDEFDNIFCSIRDGLITYDTDLRIHFVNRPLLQMLGLSSETYTSRFYEGQMAGSIFRIYMNGENILQDLLKKVRTGKRPIPMIRTCWHVMRWTPLYIRKTCCIRAGILMPFCWVMKSIHG